MNKVFLPLLILILLASCSSDKQNNSEVFNLPDIIKIESGKISGITEPGSSVKVFKGIPFAAPPVGNLRWKPPQQPGKWEGIKVCDKFGASPLQAPAEPFLCWSEEFLIDMSDTSAGISEDCLTINVWTDSKPGSGNKPVIVYIYGGGYVSGGSSCEIYNGTSLAEKGAVIVSFNYRVGILGFLTHPELVKESEHNAAGNYGLLDQIAALKWVRKNIAQFGGDPDNVTIQGQSAGAGSVHALIASPKAEGLFSKAVAQSYNFLNRAAKTLDEKLVADMEQIGERSIEELRNMPAEELLKLNYRNSYFCIDGWVLPYSLTDAYKNRSANNVILITGMTTNDNMLFGFFPSQGFGTPEFGNIDDYKALLRDAFDNKYEDALKVYPVTSTAECVERYNEITTDHNNILQYELAKLRAENGYKPTYLYYFTRVMPGPDSDKWGAFHSADVPYFFDYYTPLRKSYWTDTDYNLGDTMSSYLVNFAKSGNPNNNNLPKWEPCSSNTPVFINFGNEITEYKLPSNKMELWEDYYNF